jgi:hypothetical protein
MTHPSVPEFRLAAACAIWPPSDRRTEAIRAASSVPLDWCRFRRVATRHQVIGLVREGLTGARVAVPLGIARKIDAQATALVHENLAMACEALRVQRLFDKAGLPVLFVKGTTLALLAFGNLGLRAGKDIDLLIPYEKLAAATNVLERAGYRRFDPSVDISQVQLRLLTRLRRDFGFVHEASGVRIELHWRLFLNPHAMAEASCTQAPQIVPVSGSVGLRTLGKEDLFAYLCMHGALHCWNQLKWIADINALLTAAAEDGIERLIAAAEARGVGRAATQCLLLCRRLLGTPIPARLMAPLEKSATLRWLEATALNAMMTGEGEREPREERFGTTRGSLSTFLLKRSWRYWLAELSIHLTNQTDVLSVPLPERLRFLYPMLRFPLWLWRHAAKRGAGRKGGMPHFGADGIGSFQMGNGEDKDGIASRD